MTITASSGNIIFKDTTLEYHTKTLCFLTYIYIYIYFLNSLRIHEKNTKKNHNYIVSFYVIKTFVILYVKKKLIFPA